MKILFVCTIITLVFAKASAQELSASDSTENNFLKNHYLNLQGGLGFATVDYIAANGDLRLYFGRFHSKFFNPGITIGYDVYNVSSHNLIPIGVNLRWPISQKGYLNMENGYGFPVIKNHFDRSSREGLGGFASSISIGTSSGKNTIKWHFSFGFKIQYHGEKWTPVWSDFPRENKYQMRRVFFRVGMGI